MELDASWLAAGLTTALLATYELLLLFMQRHRPARVARSAHVSLREEWFAAVSAQPGSEILAVQTLRNSLMSATMLAATSALALIGTITLAGPSLRASLGEATPRLVLELALIGLLFISLVSTVMSVRFYNHISFICAMPVASAARQRWGGTGADYLRRAGLLYSMGLRHLVLAVPVVAAIFLPLAGPAAALLVIAVLLSFDRFSTAAQAVGSER